MKDYIYCMSCGVTVSDLTKHLARNRCKIQHKRHTHNEEGKKVLA